MGALVWFRSPTLDPDADDAVNALAADHEVACGWNLGALGNMQRAAARLGACWKEARGQGPARCRPKLDLTAGRKACQDCGIRESRLRANPIVHTTGGPMSDLSDCRACCDEVLFPSHPSQWVPEVG